MARVISVLDSGELFIENSLLLIQKVTTHTHTLHFLFSLCIHLRTHTHSTLSFSFPYVFIYALTYTHTTQLLTTSDSAQFSIITVIALDLLVCLLYRELVQVSEDLQKESLPIILQLAHKLVKQGHLTVLTKLNTISLSDGDKTAVSMLLGITPHNGMGFFQSELMERIEFFNRAILIEGRVREQLLNCEQDELLGAQCVQKYLNLHFLAFSGTQTFSPVRMLKSAIYSSLSVVNAFQKSISSFTDLVVPVTVSVVMESMYQNSLSGLISGLPDFEEQSILYQLKQCLSVLQNPVVVQSAYFHRILCEVFTTAGKLLSSSGLGELFSVEGAICKFVHICRCVSHNWESCLMSFLPFCVYNIVSYLIHLQHWLIWYCSVLNQQ